MTSFAIGLEPYHSFGFGIQYRRFGASDAARDTSGFETGEDVNLSDNGVAFGAGCRFRKWVSLGYNVEYIRRNLYRHAANAVNHNVGLQFYIFNGRHVLGFSAQNIGEPVTFLYATEKMPVVFRLGGSHKIGRPVLLEEGFKVGSEPRFRILWELTQFRDSKRLSGSGGAEWRALPFMVFRAGVQYRQNLQVNSGIGFRWKNYDIDYGVQNRSEIGLAHSFSVLLRWGKEDEDFEGEE
jgi:hypothetical protein